MLDVCICYVILSLGVPTTLFLADAIIVTPITTPLQSMIMSEIVQQYYADFVKVDQVMLFELVTAANFMDIKPLLDLTCLAVSFFIKVSFDMLD